MDSKKLTLFEASCIITGYGIGSGILAMPYLSAKCGFPVTIVILLLAFLFSYLLHMMIADLSIKNGSKGQIVDIFMNYLERGKKAKALKTVMFAIVAVVLYANLAVYIAGAAEILQPLLNIPNWLGQVIFYILAASVAMFGIKILGICEKYAMIGIFAVIAALMIGSLFNIKNPLPMSIGTGKEIISFFGVAMFAFVAFFSVPQVVEGLKGNVKEIKKAIVIGMSVNLLIMVIVIVCAQLSSKELTEVSMIGWSAGIGLWAQIIGSAFTILAMLTTYWSISKALCDIVTDMLKINEKICFLIASVPSLLIALLPTAGFMDYLELTAGAIAILIALFVIPIYHISRKDGPSILGKMATVPVEIAVFAAYIMMAVGNLI